MEKRDSVGEGRRRGCDLLVRAVAWCEGVVKRRREERKEREREEFSEREKKKGEEAREREKRRKRKRKERKNWAGPSSVFFWIVRPHGLAVRSHEFSFFRFFFCNFSIFLVICIRAAARI